MPEIPVHPGKPEIIPSGNSTGKNKFLLSWAGREKIQFGSMQRFDSQCSPRGHGIGVNTSRRKQWDANRRIGADRKNFAPIAASLPPFFGGAVRLVVDRLGGTRQSVSDPSGNAGDDLPANFIRRLQSGRFHRQDGSPDHRGRLQPDELSTGSQFEDIIAHR